MKNSAIFFIVFVIVFILTLLIGAGIYLFKPQSSEAVVLTKNCESIQDDNGRDDCYFSIAEEKMNVSICLLIKDTWKKNDCVDLLT